MKLTEFFTGDKQITDPGRAQQNTVRNDAVSRQIRSMIPGQTIQGEVVSKNGNEVQIRLSDDLMLQARLDQNMNLEIGKNMTFEVKNNGKVVTLSPLFTNVATDANVLKALDMASLPINESTVSMTKQMMEAGLSIDRNSLQQVYREMNLFPQAQVSDIVNLHKLQMPVNENNLAQMEAYRNLNYQLETGLNEVLDAIPGVFAQLLEDQDAEGISRLYSQMVQMAQEALAEGGEEILLTGTGAEDTMQETAAAENAAPGTVMEEGAVSGNTAADTAAAEAVTAQTVAAKEQGITEALKGIPGAAAEEGEAAAKGGEAAADEVPSQSGENLGKNMAVSLGETAGTADRTAAQQFADILRQFPAESGGQALLSRLNGLMQGDGAGKELLKPILQLLKDQWTISPQEVADAERVEGLYRRLDRQLKNLSQTLESTGQASSQAYRTVTGLSQNLDFLQQINQAYTYVQLPLRLQQGRAHGDLYVYTNKKHLAMKDGQISALLHLDMEHLGPVDVYVAMVQDKVNTKFYVQDDDMLDFLMGHMDLLTERLQKRGYQCSFDMQVRGQKEAQEGSIDRLLQQENPIPLAEYSFDVRT